ncbi:ABC transporter ATP-binding protein [Paenibacillus lutimineralis]|uniref:ABC transporter ATP-binding protein n=1 Tax=Paenibacillus lutimineralis TaxID=2707005 RepID=A0A3Q9IG03_9BACL|nr:ABC transporter ATP-binding protein [Paenibacillus lutimineralis]AZS17235.1 ABC transporter ATP-binding protein [Paenibacillus lutimineralis]
MIIQVNQLTRKFGERTTVKGISFALEKGSCTALLGPNGAGKTTTLRMLAGLLTPSSGTITRSGRDQSKGRLSNNHSQIGYLPQHPSFYKWMSGMEFVVYAARLSGMSKQEARSEAEAVLERVGLKSAARRRISGYSGGMKQRLGLAQALVHHPDLLLLDEPVSALDPVGRREVMELLQELKGETTILLSTHVLHDAEEVCDRVMMMREGEIVENGELSDLLAKYSLPVLNLQLEHHSSQRAADWLRSLQDRSFVLEYEQQGGAATITVSNMKEARAVILSEAAERHIPLQRFEAGSSSLEKMFMKVVQS